MQSTLLQEAADPRRLNSDRLNRSCFCMTLDREALRAAAVRETGNPEFWDTLVETRPHLFSNVPVFLPAEDLAEMQMIVAAIEAAARLPGYRAAALGQAPALAATDPGPLGALMGYDFHLGPDGPKLIEVNTNAGGAFLNAMLARAQRACCTEVEHGLDLAGASKFDAAIVEMFENEWRLQRHSAGPRRIAIIDDRPREQYLFPEFLLARQLLLRAGIDAVIADPSELNHSAGRISIAGATIDLVYNRLVDFPLVRPEHQVLRHAYEEGAVVVTPNPHNHALLADKRNLVWLSDRKALAGWGLGAAHLEALNGLPRTRLVTAENAEILWAERKALFFKPGSGHGGKAVYRGDKITRGVWADIVQGSYVAQAFAPPGERMIMLDGERVLRKMDVRLYTYGGQLLLAAARLYQGQTTNFRTPGGGFAPVLTA